MNRIVLRSMDDDHTKFADQSVQPPTHARSSATGRDDDRRRWPGKKIICTVVRYSCN